MNDLKIITESIKAGSKETFGTFFRVEFENVVFFLIKYVGSRTQAEDIAQESFTALWKYRDNLDSTQNIRTYLFTIAKNRALNYLRDSEKRRKNTLLGEEALLNIRALEHSSVSQHIETLELNGMIERLYDSLPSKIREEFEMSREQGMTYAEIARKQGVSERVIEYHIALALRHFKKGLSNYIGVSTILFILSSFFKG